MNIFDNIKTLTNEEREEEIKRLEALPPKFLIDLDISENKFLVRKITGNTNAYNDLSNIAHCDSCIGGGYYIVVEKEKDIEFGVRILTDYYIQETIKEINEQINDLMKVKSAYVDKSAYLD
jgi:hypothetical protein